MLSRDLKKRVVSCRSKREDTKHFYLFSGWRGGLDLAWPCGPAATKPLAMRCTRAPNCLPKCFYQQGKEGAVGQAPKKPTPLQLRFQASISQRSRLLLAFDNCPSKPPLHPHTLPPTLSTFTLTSSPDPLHIRDKIGGAIKRPLDHALPK